MAGTRSAPKKMYAWSELRNGGETDEIPVAGGRSRRYVIKSRKIVKRGDEVTQDSIGVTDEEWEHWVETGSVRPYPLPENADDYVSPSQAFLRAVTDERGDVDVDMLLELGLTNPAVVNPPAEEAAEVSTEAK